MGFLRDGVWTDEEGFPTDASGRFVRPDSRFRRLGGEPFRAEHGRYHLYLSHACPWSHRTAIAHRLKGLDQNHRVTVSFVDPLMREGGWRFAQGSGGADGATTPPGKAWLSFGAPAAEPSPASGMGYEDPLFGAGYLHELYTRAHPQHTGRVTVPVLWDREQNTIASNESADILRMFNQAAPQPDLYPEPLRAEIDAMNERIYAPINNGVYRCGFARSQHAYEEAFAQLFAMLDELSARLREQPYLVGDYATEADIRLFVTLVRFDAVYFGHFKCNRNRIEDDEPLQAYLERLWTIPAFRETTRLDEIKRHYYGSHRAINPSGIVPVGPRLRLTEG